jgi:hypothetical protein
MCIHLVVVKYSAVQTSGSIFANKKKGPTYGAIARQLKF